MKHIHISLVGKETEPIYSMIKLLAPDEAILICSRDTYTEACTITDHINSAIVSVTIKTIPPSDLKVIQQEIISIKEDIAETDVLTLNLVGGTKFWSLSFYKQFFNRPNTHFFLIDQNKTLWNLENNLSNSIDGLDLDTILAIYGNKLISYKPISDYTEEDQQSLKKIENIRNTPHFYLAFKKLATILTKDMQEELANETTGTFTHVNGYSISWDKPDIVDFRFGKFKTRIQSPNALSLTFNSGWFEYKVARMFDGWDKSTDIRLNCIFSSRQGMTKNEVDIIVNTPIKPIFVECKTKLFNSTDIDKFSTVVKNYGGASCKGIFITDVPMNDLQVTKCKESDIDTFCLENHKANLTADLYAFLNRILLEINK